MHDEIGYGHLASVLRLNVSRWWKPVRIDGRVTSIVDEPDGLRVPSRMLPERDDLLAEVEFALKHQGVDLEMLQAVSRVMSPEPLQAALLRTPNGRYLRVFAALYEYFTGTDLRPGEINAPYVRVFDEKKYVCGPDRRMAKFRVSFNGIGTLDFCPIVRRTLSLDAVRERDLFGELDRFVASLGGLADLDRALGWAYLDETRGSFAIERETPSADKATRFVQLLHGAHEKRPLSEDYLAELQCSTMTNPLLEELAFRHQQNWLQRGGRLTAAGVTYVPPSAAHIPALMNDFMAFANEQKCDDALLHALLVSFGFVFLHPFMDGNGRISRFLIHHGLCRAGMLEQGLILPISVAMKQHEMEYLTALQSVSLPIRRLWDVTVIDEENISTVFNGTDACYRYWDATESVVFGYRMAHHALDHSLIAETVFLENFDLVRKRIEDRFDLRDKDLHALIRMAHSQHGTLSANRRKQYALTVQAGALDAIEQEVRAVFFPPQEDGQ